MGTFPINAIAVSDNAGIDRSRDSKFSPGTCSIMDCLSTNSNNPLQRKHRLNGAINLNS